MKTFKYFAAFAAALMAICNTSCGNSDPNSVTLKVESELGELGNCLAPSEDEVVVRITEENEDGENVRFFVSSLAFNVSKSVASNRSFKIKVEVLDENHLKIGELPDFKIDSKSDHDNGEYDHILATGATRAQMKEEVENQELWDKIHSQGKYIVLKPNSYAKYAEYNSGFSSNSDNQESTTAASSGSEDWDALLDSYDSYVTQFVSYAKKAANGDVTALSEYPALLEKAQEFSGKMNNAQSQMSASQWTRYVEITNKMTQALAEMR